MGAVIGEATGGNIEDGHSRHALVRTGTRFKKSGLGQPLSVLGCRRRLGPLNDVVEVAEDTGSLLGAITHGSRELNHWSFKDDKRQQRLQAIARPAA